MNSETYAHTLSLSFEAPPSELQQPPQDVLSIWASYPPAPADNAILMRFGGFTDVCRVVTDGGMINDQSVQDWLVLPLHDAQHNMTGLAYLPPNPTASRSITATNRVIKATIHRAAYCSICSTSRTASLSMWSAIPQQVLCLPMLDFRWWSA